MTVTEFVKGDLAATKTQTELRKVKKEISALKKKLTALQARKAEIEQATGKKAGGLRDARG